MSINNWIAIVFNSYFRFGGDFSLFSTGGWLDDDAEVWCAVDVADNDFLEENN